MPLIKSKSKGAFVSNLKAELSAGKKRDQALAIAYSVKRKARAEGGAVHTGPINSIVPGRTDHHPMDVAAGSYVLPADHVSSLGEGNTSAGMAALNHMFTAGPYGIKALKLKHGMHGKKKFADGGEVEGAEAVPINAAGGEYVIPPEIVAAIGDGDLQHGHAILDKWVVDNRKMHRKTLAALPGPAQD